MNNELLAVPYYMTIGDKQYKNYVNSPFSHNILNSISDEGLFDDWKFKNLGNWCRYNKDNDIIEFYVDHYVVKTNNVDYKLPIPQTIDQFLNDMNRLNIKIIWLNKILTLFEPKIILSKNNIESYYRYLLKKMNKSYELL